jgi:hypothetical protein
MVASLRRCASGTRSADVATITAFKAVRADYTSFLLDRMTPQIASLAQTYTTGATITPNAATELTVKQAVVDVGYDREHKIADDAATTAGVYCFSSFGFAWASREDVLPRGRVVQVSFDSGDVYESTSIGPQDVYDQADPSLPAPTNVGCVMYRVSSLTVDGEWTHPSGWTFTT